jgi:hypothetical protein
LVGGVAALLLCVVAYQNVVVIPRLNAEIAQLQRPSILSSVFLVGGNARGATIPTVTASRSTPLLLSVDVPTAEQYGSYASVLVTPSGTALWSLPVTGEQAKDTVPIVVPTDSLSHGTYTLVVQGYSKGAGKGPDDLAHYRFTVGGSN